MKAWFEALRGIFKIGSLRPPSGQKHQRRHNFWLGTVVDPGDSGTAVYRLTRSLEIWMGENLLTPFTEGTSLLNRAYRGIRPNN